MGHNRLHEARDLRAGRTGGDQTVNTAYRDVVVTQEWTPLEPDITEQKSYAPGVGLITEDLVRGGTEHHELVSFSGHP